MSSTRQKTILKKMNKLILDKFSELLRRYGFQIIRNKIERYSSEIIYVNNDKLYITFIANINPRDYPPYFNILLGQGSIEWPDYDWNHVTLWSLAKSIDKEDDFKEYSLEGAFKLEDILERGKKDLLKYAQDFLKGDLDCFYQVRKEINAKREPYKIYTSGKKGISEKYDEESIRLKNKYS